MNTLRETDIILNDLKKINKITSKFRYSNNQLLSLIKEVYRVYKFLPERILIYIAKELKISPVKILGAAAYYSYFGLKSKGKYVIKLCNGSACHSNSVYELSNTIKKYLKIGNSRNTTTDMLFTVETISCHEASESCPSLIINNTKYHNITSIKALAIIDTIIEAENNRYLEFL